MPSSQTEKLYGLPGPQNSAVLMEIITKLKQDLQQSRAENSKLVDQLNCLISLVKRAWTGEQGAMMHLANIIGLEAPTAMTSGANRNTPIPDKSRAVQNWERLSIKLLQKDYAEVQAEIQERQRLYLQNRQTYMQEVIVDHEQEMSRFSLHKKSTVEDVDRQFIRCFSAKTRGNKPAKSAYRPHSAYRSQPRSAADMAERADVNVTDIIGHHASTSTLQNKNQSNSTITSLYRLTEDQKRQYRPQPHFDDPSRYKQNNLFDPDVIFSPEMMSPARDKKDRPDSATSVQSAKATLRTRPKSAGVFMTEQRPERPLKYETTRPISGKPVRQTASASHLGRRNSAPSKKTAPSSASIKKKELHTRFRTDSDSFEDDRYSGSQPVQGHDADRYEDGNQMHDNYGSPHGDHFAGHENENGNQEGDIDAERAPMTVNVKKNDPINQFVEDLKLMTEMENDFKKSAVQLQKKLGLESSGFVYS